MTRHIDYLSFHRTGSCALFCPHIIIGIKQAEIHICVISLLSPHLPLTFVCSVCSYQAYYNKVTAEPLDPIVMDHFNAAL